MHTTFDIANYYTLEDLLPIVASLAKKFTSCESTSVTYERAQSFMEAVIYCIRHFYENENQDGNIILCEKSVPAEMAYTHGYESVCAKVKKTLEKYNQMLECFDHYENVTYHDTVEKGIAAFFLHYDPVFAPMENVITMDYPVPQLDVSLEGIDRLEQYIDLICEEQVFLQRFPREFVLEELRMFHPMYEKEILNLKEIILTEQRGYTPEI